MAKQINCDGGYVVTGADDDELVAEAEQHDRPELAGQRSREQLLSMATEA